MQIWDTHAASCPSRPLSSFMTWASPILSSWVNGVNIPLTYGVQREANKVLYEVSAPWMSTTFDASAPDLVTLSCCPPGAVSRWSTQEPEAWRGRTTYPGGHGARGAFCYRWRGSGIRVSSAQPSPAHPHCLCPVPP